MKKSILFLAGMAALLLSFGLVLAGCASNGTDSTGIGNADGVAKGTAQAVELAADINAIRPGSAEASGDTVTIVGGFVEIRNGLTVPEGITLEVTASGSALGLRDSALTVNGTVNAGPDHIRLEDNASWGTVNGSGTIRLKGQGNLLRVSGNKNVANRQLTLDGVTLVGLPDNNATLVEVRDGGELFLKSGKISGNKIVAEGGTPGGGVSVFDGIFTMTGGEISDNSAREAGGIAIGGSTFTMKGGAIFGNTGGYTGGVSIGRNATFIMEDGAIFGNTAEDFGGVGIVNGTFTLKGGRIQGSTDSDGFIKNTGNKSAALVVMAQNGATAKWGTGGTYTKGGESQSGGSDIDSTDDTLIAAP